MQGRGSAWMRYATTAALVSLLGCAVEATPAVEETGAPDWSASAQLPASGDRRDILHLGDKLPEMASRGLLHMSTWPVSVSGVLLPVRPVAMIFDPKATDPNVLQLQEVGRVALGFGTTDEMNAWLGLSRRGPEAEAFAGVAWPAALKAGDFLGVGAVDSPLGPGLTFSCATCHVATFFGKSIVGMANRKSRANVFFGMAKDFFPAVTPDLLKMRTQATDAEVAMMERAKVNLPAVGWMAPQVHGLDTSLAQVALSLARRAPDGWASRDPVAEETPRPSALDTQVVDSKPAVWWTLKYKTRWLSDGSIVSGNPVFTNFLWNELGRGTDLHELDAWMEKNPAIIDELTALVFAVLPPRWDDVFPDLPLDVTAAQRGQALFVQHCTECHGTYDKDWASGTRTTKLHYPTPTPVLDVGTDLQRADGMMAFAEGLNRLEISKKMNTLVVPQKGYVPPPLEAVWARYPYLHNQSVPSLCEMLRPAKFRTTRFWLGPDANVKTDFDPQCVGLPVGSAVPESWKEDPHNEMDTQKPGLRNVGHEAHLLRADGQEVFDAAQRLDLVAFLKTL